jgi:hypothetical protein
MLRGDDVIVLLDLLGGDDRPTVRVIAARTGLPLATVHRALGRLAAARLVDDARRPVRANVAEFLAHALRYLLPAVPGGEVRGTPTAWAAAPLAAEIAADDPLPPVWPDPDGGVRGLAVAPLHPAAVRAARTNPELAARLALVDAIRIGDARVRGVATRLLLARTGLAG